MEITEDREYTLVMHLNELNFVLEGLRKLDELFDTDTDSANIVDTMIDQIKTSMWMLD